LLLKLLDDAEQDWCKSGTDKYIENNAKASYRFIANKIKNMFEKTEYQAAVPDILRGRGMKYISIHPATGRSFKVSF
jgi:hypothetical protein